MLGAFYTWQQGDLRYEEAYVDVSTGTAVPVKREVLKP